MSPLFIEGNLLYTNAPNLDTANWSDTDGTLVGEQSVLIGTTTVGQWSSLTFRFPDQTGWILKPATGNPDHYVMDRAFNVLSQAIYVIRASGKITSLRNETGDLLRLNYNNPGGLLSRVFDNTVANRYVDYTIGAGDRTTELLAVSQTGRKGGGRTTVDAMNIPDDLLDKDLPSPSLSEMVAPFRQQVAESEMSEEELDQLFAEAREEAFRDLLA